MLKRAPGLLIGLATAAMIAGCTSFDQIKQTLNPPDKLVISGGYQEIIDVDLISMSHAIADALVAELRKNHPSYRRHKPLMVTSFVDLADMESSTELGLLLSDQIASRMTQHGYSVVEAKLRHELSIKPGQGEFILTRDIEKLSNEYRAFAVVAGNYTLGRDILYLTIRIIRVKDKQVLASVNAKIPMGMGTRDMLVDTASSPSLRVVDQ